jgi:hypothetical protein
MKKVRRKTQNKARKLAAKSLHGVKNLKTPPPGGPIPVPYPN